MKGIEFLDNNLVVCPFCQGQLMHVMKEENTILLSPGGEPESEVTDYIDKVICSNRDCNEEFRFVKEGINIILTDPRFYNRTEHVGKLYKIAHSKELNISNGFGKYDFKEE